MKNTCIYPGTQTPGIDSQYYSQHFPQDYSQGYSQNYSQDYVQTHWTSDSVQPWQKKLFWQFFIKKCELTLLMIILMIITAYYTSLTSCIRSIFGQKYTEYMAKNI